MTTLAIHFTKGDPCEITLAGQHLMTFTVAKDDICYLIGAFKGNGRSCPVTKGDRAYWLHTNANNVWVEREGPGLYNKINLGYLSPARRVALLKKLEKA